VTATLERKKSGQVLRIALLKHFSSYISETFPATGRFHTLLPGRQFLLLTAANS
jgi:hypothetical protein